MSIKHLTPKSEEELRKVLQNLPGREKIEEGCKQGFLWLVKDAVERDKFNPSYGENSPLLWAAQRGYTNIVEYLLKDSRVNPSVNNSLSLRSATYYNQYDVVKLLLSDPRVDPTAKNYEAIRDAIVDVHARKDYSILKLLLKDKRIKLTEQSIDEIFNIMKKHYIIKKEDIYSILKKLNYNI
jgi:hypothetical protein